MRAVTVTENKAHSKNFKNGPQFLKYKEILKIKDKMVDELICENKSNLNEMMAKIKDWIFAHKCRDDEVGTSEIFAL